MIDRFVFEQQDQSAEEVEKMIQKQNEKDQKPISDSESSQDNS